MIPHSIANASSSFLLHVIDPALRSLVLGGIAAIALYVFRVKNPTARLAVWSGVLYAALAMPLLGLALPSVSLPVPSAFFALLAKTTAASAPTVTSPSIAAADSTSSVAKMSVVASSEPETAAAQIKYLPEPAESSPAPRVRVARTHRHPEKSTSPIIISTEVGQPAAEVHVAATTAPPPTPKPAPNRAYTWPLVAGFFCIIAAFMLGRILLGAIIAGRLARSADTVAEPEAICILLRQARAAGVASAPRLAESDVVSVPVALGVTKPVILLPVYWRKWDEPTLAAVIAHEMSHIARRDALTQRLALIHRALFWFSPLAWWLNRSLADAAEEASDEAALLAGADRAFYAETLLGFFAALSENSRRRVYWQGVSMAAPGQAERRVDRILNWKGAISMRIRKSLAIGLVLFGVPVALLTAAARPATTDDLPPTPPAPRAPAAPVLPSAVPQNGVMPVPGVPQAAPVPEPAPAPFLAEAALQVPRTPAAPPAPAAVPPPPAPVAPSDVWNSDGSVNKEKMDKFKSDVKDYAKEMKEFSFQFKDGIDKNFNMNVVMPKMDIEPFIYAMQDGPVVKITNGDFNDRFVIVSDDSPIIMSGGSQDVEHATALRSTIKGDFIWFQHDEKSYVIRDQNLVNQAKAFYKPEQDLGAKQRDLGNQQRALGDQQRDLGQKMRDMKVTVPDMSADMQKLQDQLKQLSSSGATQQQVGEVQRQLGEMMRKLGQTQSQVGDQDHQIGEQQRQLGDKQRELGDQQRDLGHQQRDASQQARAQMKQLLSDALAKGTAQLE